jgi:hypothetical protein
MAPIQALEVRAQCGAAPDEASQTSTSKFEDAAFPDLDE